jgi:hypothetical protein
VVRIGRLAALFFRKKEKVVDLLPTCAGKIEASVTAQVSNHQQTFQPGFFDNLPAGSLLQIFTGFHFAFGQDVIV